MNFGKFPPKKTYRGASFDRSFKHKISNFLKQNSQQMLTGCPRNDSAVQEKAQ